MRAFLSFHADRWLIPHLRGPLRLSCGFPGRRGAGLLALYQSDFAPAEGFFAAALELFRPLGDGTGTSSSLLMLGIAAEDTGAYERAAASISSRSERERALRALETVRTI